MSAKQTIKYQVYRLLTDNPDDDFDRDDVIKHLAGKGIKTTPRSVQEILRCLCVDQKAKSVFKGIYRAKQ